MNLIIIINVQVKSKFKLAQTSFNTFKRLLFEGLTSYNTLSRNSNIIVPFETSFIAEQDARIFVR